MVQKHKNYKLHIASSVVSHLGVIVMIAATFVNMAELAEREGTKVAAALQPAFSFASVTAADDGSKQSDHTSRQAKEEIGHSSASYGAPRRSASVTGTL